MFFETATDVFGYQPELTKKQIRGIDAAFSHFTNSTLGAALSVTQNGNMLYKQGFGAYYSHYPVVNISCCIGVQRVYRIFYCAAPSAGETLSR